MPDAPGIRWLAAGIDSVPADDDWLTAHEQAWADQMRFPKRRTEYRLARWCAKQAIAATLQDAPPFRAIGIGHLPEGAPAGYVGGEPMSDRISMTDRADWAVCAIGPPGVEVGCDLELVEERSGGFIRDYFTAAEQETTLSRPGAIDVLANLVWSAKESALKVMRTGLRRDTRSVEVTLDDGFITEGAGWQRLQVTADDGRVFPGWWRRYGDFVLTLAGSAGTAEPRSLDEPSALATARPSHGWMPSA